MAKAKVPSFVKAAACNYWQANKGNSSLEEVANKFGISRPTLSRALQEKGYKKTFNNHKTKEEKRMLQYLTNKGINDLAGLKKHI